MLYTTSQELINEVENELSMWFNTGKVDKSTLPSIIRACLAKMGNLALPSKETVLDICDYKAKLPEGFDKVMSAMCCTRSQRLALDGRILTETEQICDTECGSYERLGNFREMANEVCVNSCQTGMFKIVQKFNTHVIEWDNIDYMEPSKSSQAYCLGDCFKIKSKCSNEFEIKNGYFHTNFETGAVLLIYKLNLENEEGFMVPDYPEITEWIKQAMITQVFKTLYRNGEDVVQKLNFEKNELRILELNAMAFYRPSSVQNYLNTAKIIASDFNLLDQSQNASPRYIRR